MILYFHLCIPSGRIGENALSRIFTRTAVRDSFYKVQPPRIFILLLWGRVRTAFAAKGVIQIGFLNHFI